MIVCERHGRQSCSYVSPEVEKLVLAQALGAASLVWLSVNIFRRGHVLVDQGFLEDNLHEDEKKRYLLDADRSLDVFDELSPVCGKCFDDFLVLSNITRPVPVR